MPQTDSQQKTVGLILGHESTEDINDQLNWAMIEWGNLERRVYKVQKRIYKASSRDDVRTVRRLQVRCESRL